jgi:hypothetical protein
MVMSEEVILSKIFLDISMSLDGLIAQPHDDPGPIHEFFFSDETKHDGIFVRESYDAAAAVITGRRTYEFTNGCEGNLPMWWRASWSPMRCRPMCQTALAVHLRDRRDRHHGSSGRGRRRREGCLDLCGTVGQHTRSCLMSACVALGQGR